jgi:predicted dehydrogenase
MVSTPEMIYYLKIYHSLLMNPLHCAVIGCGRIGCGFDEKSNLRNPKTHAGSYFVNSKTKLVALCDIDKSKLEKFGKKFNVDNLYTDTKEMFDKENLDCISICTLVDTHLDLVEEAIRFGVKAIFLEKPISDSLDNAHRIVTLCKKNNVTLIIDHQRRFDPVYHSVQNFIKKKNLGNLQLFDVHYGAGIANTGSHVFDMLRMFFGEVSYVSAKYSKNKSVNVQDPNLDVSLEFTNGMLCNLHALDVSNYGILEMDVFGTMGRLRFNLATSDVEYFKTSDKDFLVYKNLIQSKIKINKSTRTPISLGIQNMVNCVMKKDSPLSTGMDGYKSLELIVASLKSSKLNRRIHLPMVRNSFKIKSR